MKVVDQRNELLQKFFITFDLDKEGLTNFCLKNNIENISEIIAEFKDIRKEIYDYLWQITEPNLKLLPAEIVRFSKIYLMEHYIWIDDQSIKSVNNFLLWMCWHEGIMK